MRLQTSATQVAQRTSHLLQKAVRRREGVVKAIQEPAWFKVVAANPPSHDLIHRARNYDEFVNNKHTKKQISTAADFQIGQKTKTGKYLTRNKNLGEFRVNAKHLYKPRPIRYIEDRIRKSFYQQHPWELARPRLLVEKSGDDHARLDSWSSMVQKNKALDGESVVQRTLYLWNEHNATSGAALDFYAPASSWLPFYEQARLEFYRLRIREEAEIDVATEEATMYGRVFGKSAIDHGIEQEQIVIDQWVEEASEATKAYKARSVSQSAIADVDLVEQPEQPET